MRFGIVTVRELRDCMPLKQRLHVLEVVEVRLQLHHKLVDLFLDPQSVRLPSQIQLLVERSFEVLFGYNWQIAFAVNSALHATDHLYDVGIRQLRVHRHSADDLAVLIIVRPILWIALIFFNRVYRAYH